MTHIRCARASAESVGCNCLLDAIAIRPQLSQQLPAYRLVLDLDSNLAGTRFCQCEAEQSPALQAFKYRQMGNPPIHVHGFENGLRQYFLKSRRFFGSNLYLAATLVAPAKTSS